MKARRTSGYSEEVASVYVSEDTDVVLLSTKPEPRVRWENHKPTDEIIGYRSQVLQLVYRRQSEYLKSHDNINKQFPPVVVTIDELSALTTGANKRIIDSFFSLLQTITLLARESNVHLILISQELDAKTIPTSVRSQCNLRILMGLVISPDF